MNNPVKIGDYIHNKEKMCEIMDIKSYEDADYLELTLGRTSLENGNRSMLMEAEKVLLCKDAIVPESPLYKIGDTVKHIPSDSLGIVNCIRDDGLYVLKDPNRNGYGVVNVKDLELYERRNLPISYQWGAR